MSDKTQKPSERIYELADIIKHNNPSLTIEESKTRGVIAYLDEQAEKK